MSSPVNAADLVPGVIGGLGPDATVDFMARIIALTPAKTDQDHLHLLVDQNPKVPNRQDAILRRGESPAAALAAMAAGLEAAGADFIVMPCNTAHAFEQRIQSAIGIPFISIITATLEAIPDETSTVGILETPAGKNTGLYRLALQESARPSVELDAAGCEELMRLAYAVKGGDRSAVTRRSIKSLAQGLVASGAQAIIVGCTEIPLILAEDDAGVALISSTDALARKTIALARAQIPLPTID